MYSRNLDLCVSGKKDVVIPGEFHNLKVNLENEGCVRTIFFAARACFCSMKASRVMHFWMRSIGHEYFLTYTGKYGFISFSRYPSRQ